MANKQLLRLKAVLPLVGLKRSAIYARVLDGRFPSPSHVGRAAVWTDAEIAEWVEYISRHRHEPPVGTYSNGAA